MLLNRFWTLKAPIPLFSRLTFQFRVRILHHSGFSQESDAIDWIDARFHLARLRFGRARKLCESSRRLKNNHAPAPFAFCSCLAALTQAGHFPEAGTSRNSGWQMKQRLSSEL
jgi:hypothetical protein